MINDVELLQDICESSEMGRDSIMHVIKLTDDPGFRKTLETQLTEFANMYDTADKMLQERGSRPSSIGPRCHTCLQTPSAAFPGFCENRGRLLT